MTTAVITDHSCQATRERDRRARTWAKAFHTGCLVFIGAVIGAFTLTLVLVYTGQLELPVMHSQATAAKVIQKAYSADGTWECYKPAE